MSPQLKMEFDGVEELEAKLNTLENHQTYTYLMPGMAEEGAKEASVYPPPQTDYERTGRLGRNWYTSHMGPRATIGNLTPYFPWVHGDQQIELHGAHGWLKLRDVMEVIMLEGIGKLIKRITQIWSR